jgi:hypothetical protein
MSDISPNLSRMFIKMRSHIRFVITLTGFSQAGRLVMTCNRTIARLSLAEVIVPLLLSFLAPNSDDICSRRVCLPV